MNYTLTLSLEGDQAVNAQLSKVMASVDKISSGKVSVFDKVTSNDIKQIDKAIEGMGENIGKNLGEKVKKGFRGVLWNSKEMLGTPRLPSMPEWLNKITEGVSEINSNSGLAQFINQRHAPSGKKVDKDFWNQNFPPIIPGITKGLKEPTGKDLAKVLGLPDINSLIAPKMDWKKILIGAGLGISNPYIGSRLLSDEFGKGGSGTVAGGLFGKGGIAGFSEIFLAFKGIKFAINIFKWSVDKFSQSIARADRMYSQALQNGLGLGFSVKRSMMASIMGVSEQDIFKFGNQMAYLNSRTESASRILSQTAVPLTQVSWDFKILKEDMGALWATVSSEFAPAIDGVILGIKGVIEVFNNLANSKFFKYANMLSSAITLGPAYSAFALAGSLNQRNMPGPSSWMNRLPASTYEHMGLQIAGGSVNYAKDTAKNTAVIAKAVTAMAKVESQYMHTGGGWNMMPTMNNP